MPLNLTKAHEYEYDYDFVFYFERKYFDRLFVAESLDWINKYWYISIVYAACYITLVHLGQHFMRNREKFHLYRSLVAWNVVLAGFSILGSIRFLPNFVQVIHAKGLVHSVCVLDFVHGVPACWAWLYMISKSTELIDTAFIVMRKQKLIFLHWYHHAITLIYTWYSFRDLVAYGRWFIAMNYFIHSIMYSYYVFRALRFQIPKSVSIIITSLQLLQMVVGIFVNLVAAYELYSGRNSDCHVTPENIYFSFLLYFTFFLLFFHYFRNAYIKKPPRGGDNSQVVKSLKPNTNEQAKFTSGSPDNKITTRAGFLKDIFKKLN